ncbi:hypothetical protein [Rhizobium vallis]|uniref:hypothetical protein n=1 Tax=Rhizobium vallis TaxID=634290 RepID=UPI0013E0CC8C|nr:hypothetical protein [Rhizobium vallis]
MSVALDDRKRPAFRALQPISAGLTGLAQAEFDSCRRREWSVTAATTDFNTPEAGL